MRNKTERPNVVMILGANPTCREGGGLSEVNTITGTLNEENVRYRGFQRDTA